MYRERDAEAIAKLEPTLTRKFAELADRVILTVPPVGKFDPLFATFDDETKSLDIVSWSVKVRDLIFDRCSEDVLSKRYLELVGYLGGGYCITRIVGSGEVEECAKLLRSQAFSSKVMETMRELLSKCDDL